MERTEAINMVAEQKIRILSTDEKISLLVQWWNIDEDDEEFLSLPYRLKKEMKENEEFGNPNDKKYEPLLLKALIHQYKGVKNEYIENEIKEYADKIEVVVGEVEEFEKCPCCGYKTLEERKNWEVCKVCYWEDDGIEELDIHSGSNRMTLRQAKENFKNFDACDEELIQYTEKEPDLKYQF